MFKVGDKVFDSYSGFGVVVEICDRRQTYPIRVRLSANRLLTFTTSGNRFTNEYIETSPTSIQSYITKCSRIKTKFNQLKDVSND